MIAIATLVACSTFCLVRATLGPLPRRPIEAPRAARRRSWTTALERLHSARRARRAAAALVDDVPDLVDVMVAVASSGANVRGVVRLAVEHHRGPAADVVAKALDEVALGSRLGDALEVTAGRLDPAAREALRPVVAVLVDCDHYGTPAALALSRLGDDLRLHRQRRAEERARRVPVRLLLPLVLCVLPAFALLTVAPLLAGMAREAVDGQTPSLSEGTRP